MVPRMDGLDEAVSKAIGLMLAVSQGARIGRPL